MSQIFYFENFQLELIAPTTVKTTEHYMENGKRSKDSQMVGDYGVEEWRDGGKLTNSFGSLLLWNLLLF